MKQQHNLLALFLEVQKLKKLKREGWRRHLPDEKVESVADHTFSTAFMCLCIDVDEHINREKLVSMALVHDLAEIYVGDITPHQDIETIDKHEQEKKAIYAMFAKSPQLQHLPALLEEYNEQKTPEAKLLKEIDKLEMAFQAFDYEQKELSQLGEFFDSTEERLVAHNSKLLPLFLELLQQRKH